MFEVITLQETVEFETQEEAIDYMQDHINENPLMRRKENEQEDTK